MARGRAVRAAEAQGASTWSDRYGGRHRLAPVELPQGVRAPAKVRIYRRTDHYVLQWWDPAAKRNLCDRVDGDLIAAVARARDVDERVRNYRASGQASRRARHADVVKGFLDDLEGRADAGEVRPGTVARYRSALAHYTAFASRPDVTSRYAYATGVDRHFALEFAAFLGSRSVTPNGSSNGRTHPMRGLTFVLDAVRAMLQWAADPERGRLLPDGFRNPFLGASRRSRSPAESTEDEPDITTDMAVDFVSACDSYQLRLFAPVILYGLRPGELGFLFHEHVSGDSLHVDCLPELLYTTKGNRNKKLPLVSAIRPLIDPAPGAPPRGLLFLRRRVVSGREKPSLASASLDELAVEFTRRCAEAGTVHTRDRLRVRNGLMRDAGAVTLKTVEREFAEVAGGLGWPRRATANDFRHLFATTLENGGMPEHYRKYLMGHSRGRAAIVRYTHLNEVRARYEAAVEREWPGLVAEIERRAQELGIVRADRASA